ncbi:MAG: hypothetical protein RR739_04285 [Clostridia bacterium]
MPASANAAAEAIDGFKWPEVLGTLAGDNTILVIACADVDAEQLVARFKALART